MGSMSKAVSQVLQKGSTMALCGQHCGMSTLLMQQPVLPVQLAALKMNPDFLNRDVNANFSGGEKKRNEILQLSVLEVRHSFIQGA